MSDDRNLPIVPVTLAVGAGTVAFLLGLRWLDHAGVDNPAPARAERLRSRPERAELRAVSRDTADDRVPLATRLDPSRQLTKAADRTDRVMDDLAAAGRPVVRCLLAEPLAGGKARRPQVLDVVGQPEGAHLLAFANQDAIYMSLPERRAGSALLAPEGYLPIEISWTTPPEGDAAPCSPEPLQFEEGGGGIVGLVFSDDAPAPDAVVVVTCGDEVIEGGTDAAGEFYLPAPPGPCRIDAVRGEGANPLASEPIDIEVPENDDVVVELTLLDTEVSSRPGIRAVDGGVEMTTSDPTLADLGIAVGDTILQIGEQGTNELSVDETEALLQRVAAGELSVTWRTPDGAVETRHLDP